MARIEDGAVNFTSTVEVTGAATLDSTLGVTGAITPTGGIAAPSGGVVVTQATLGNVVQSLVSTATNDDPTEDTIQGRAATTNATITTVLTIPITASNTYYISAEVIGRRTGGSAGTADWCGFGRITKIYKTVSGTVTLSQAPDNTFTADWGGSFDFTISSTNILIQVTGATNNNISWHVFAKVRKVGS